MRKETLETAILKQLLIYNAKNSLYPLDMSDPTTVRNNIIQQCENFKIDHIKEILLDTTAIYPINTISTKRQSTVKMIIIFQNNCHATIEQIYTYKAV